jgi:hypothetical protein
MNGDFITWASDNIKLSEINIACSAISKMFQCLLPKFPIAKIQQIISLKKGVLMSHPKQVKYLEIWDFYYTNIFTPTFDSTAKYNFLQKKISIFLGFFFMLRPFKSYQATINRNQEHNKNPHLGYWLVTNKKLLLSNIWIPNLLYPNIKNNLPVPQTEHQDNNP